MSNKSDFTVTSSTVSSIKNNITLPTFQRGYVWNSIRKSELIDSLHKGFPFGSLLTFNSRDTNKEELLDGQQRWSTIMDYDNNSAKYWKKLNMNSYKKYYNKINNWIIGNSNINMDEYDNVLSGKYPIADWVDEKMQEYDFGNKNAKDIRDQISSCQKLIKEYLNIDDIQVPLITYKGKKENIASIFENLNKGGLNLSKFQIYAASWSYVEIKLDGTPFQNEILNYVKDYYINKKDEAKKYDLDIENFSEDELTKSRKINLFEFGMSLGKFTQKRLTPLISDTEKQMNEFGFGILGIFANISPKELGKLINKKDLINNNIEYILKNVDNISNKLSPIFQKLNILHTKNNNNGVKYTNSLNTTYKILSYFSSLWNVNNKKTEKIILNNIPVYYVLDYLRGSWGNSGDTRLLSYYPSNNNRNYKQKIDKKEFLRIFDSWIVNENTQKERFTPAVQSISNIHANLTYLSNETKYGEPFQYEHIYSKARIRKYDKDKNIFLGNLGNIMYLPKSLNLKKQTKTLYEVKKKDNYDLLIKESSYPSKDDFDKLEKYAKNNEFDKANSIILKRAKIVANDIVSILIKNKFD